MIFHGQMLICFVNILMKTCILILLKFFVPGSVATPPRLRQSSRLNSSMQGCPEAAFYYSSCESCEGCFPAG